MNAEARSFLFVPGDSERKFVRALDGTADALILDLEDSVTADQKASARPTVVGMIDKGRMSKQIWVRVNALDTPWTLADLAAVVPARPFGIVIPKIAHGDELRQVAHYLDALETSAGIERGEIRIMLIATEVARAMFGLGSYANVTPRLWGISWGAEDLAADLGAAVNRIEGDYTPAFALARSLCLFAAAAAGVRALDTVCVDLDDLAVVTRESALARRDGFVGKLAIHPKHVDPINLTFTPSADELAWANGVVAAFAANPQAGTLRFDGKMIDRPHLRAARRLLGQSS